jgi:hypothetical protein
MNVGFRIPSSVETEPAGRTFDVRQYLNFVGRASGGVVGCLPIRLQ